jgi:hypothetical protein
VRPAATRAESAAACASRWPAARRFASIPPASARPSTYCRAKLSL